MIPSLLNKFRISRLHGPVLRTMASPSVSETINVLNYEDMKKLENKKDVLIIDVRNPNEIESTGLIGGSINIPLPHLEDAFQKYSPSEFRTKFGREKPSHDSPMVFTCRSGVRASKAAELISRYNYKSVKVYKGSWEEWEQKLKEQTNSS